MKKIILIVLLIVILVVASLVIVKIIRKPEVTKWPPGTEFPREPTLEDEIPRLIQGYQYEVENWWYSGTLKGDDNKTYVFKLAFNSGPRVQLLFGEFKESGLPTIYGCTDKFDVQKNSNSVTLKCLGVGGSIRATIAPPDNSHIIVDVSKYKLDLNFKSRGLPYWYGNGFGASVDDWVVNGHEDLSNIDGNLQYDGESVKLNGQGVFERAVWVNPITLTSTNWYPTHFDQGYALIFRAKGSRGSLYKDAFVSIGKNYNYINDSSKINIELEIEGQVPIRNHITIDTDFGKLEMFGEFKGRVEQDGIHLVYDYTGTFTYANGITLILTGGNGWDEYRPW